MQLFELLSTTDSSERLDGMKGLFAEGDEEANAAYEEVVELMAMAQGAGVDATQLVFDPTLARGLNYYTGAISEVRVPTPNRQYLWRWTLRRFDRHLRMGWHEWRGHQLWCRSYLRRLGTLRCLSSGSLDQPQVLVVQMDEEGKTQAIEAMRQLRAASVRTVLYPDVVKLKKQLKHASELNVQYVFMAGADERSKGVWTVRNMQTGEQTECSLAEAVALVRG